MKSSRLTKPVLVMAEAGFESAAEAQALELPAYPYREVSDDVRFTGGRLAEYGMPLPA